VQLLAALLRANKIQCALIYQRTKLDNNIYCLHGLNSVYLEPYGWCRIDARGKQEGVVSLFSPPAEHLSFPPSKPGERIFEIRFIPHSLQNPNILMCHDAEVV
jgi:transglutaminase-like putative cysteine protease